ncbi:hypothetical protein H2200_005082 [Cladophialophora chaetospira]|uniref:Uncharacterized protein n=1 Tax=Cladophialophora chaetospira TaxID=386627 RepID=A0AA39CJA6_9EURO|nr:hypothetical protein H2200_005082 [Cladophialophora chaetospira]
MPVYLVHGFRWPREGFSGIRVHAVINNLDNLSAEYIQNANSRRDLLRSFRDLYPEIMKELDHSDPETDTYVQPGILGASRAPGGRRLEFIEQYNPEDLEGEYAVSQPYAYVGDKVVVIAVNPGMGNGSNRPGTSTTSASQQKADTPSPTQTQRKPPSRGPTGSMSKAAPFTSYADITALSVNVEEVIADGPGLTNKAWEALADLRDKIAEGEKIGWWVVYNGDPDRSFDGEEDEYNDDEGDEYEEMEDVEEEDETEAIARAAISPTSSTTVTSPGAGGARGHRPAGSDNAPIPTSSIGAYPTTSTAPAASTLGHIASQQQPQSQYQTQRQGSSPSLTALPVRPSNPGPAPQPSQAQVQQPTRSRPNTAPSEGKGKQKERDKDVPEDPSKLKEANKPLGLRKKFFGRRT